jgi:DNA-binding MarR family transcriptional regulator
MGDLSNLKANEEILLELLWSNEKPMTSVDMLETGQLMGWNETYFYRTIKSLSEKGLIKVCGVERYNTQYARRFEVALSREEYAVNTLKSRGIDKNSIGRLAMALVKDCEEDLQDEEKEKLIEDLEEIISDLRKEKE